ncbi:MAG TPA: hypothetical protein VKD71_08735 [Gemmataceae bacterium]|nr:hypothetical protein [Gemmataceae bacterium]
MRLSQKTSTTDIAFRQSRVTNVRERVDVTPPRRQYALGLDGAVALGQLARGERQRPSAGDLLYAHGLPRYYAARSCPINDSATGGRFVDVRYPTIDEPATPEYVLAVLRDMHRQLCQWDPEADPAAVVSFDTTVAEWRDACDLLSWRELGRAYNQVWGIACSDEEWRAVLEPARQRRLADVCQLIAACAARPVIRPSRLLGSSCAPAGAFLTIRSLLHEAGAPAGEIAPSTPLAAYTRRFAGVFLGPVSRLAPGALPPVRARTPVYNAAIWGILVAVVCLLVGAYGGVHFLTVAGVVLFASCYALTWYAARRLLPASVEFGELRTFRDLAIIVAAANPVRTS